MLGEAKRLAAVHAERLEGAPATHECLVVHVDHGLAGRDEPSPGNGERKDVHARTGSGNGAPIASSSGRAFTSDSSISSCGIGVPDDAATHPEMDVPIRDRERADGERKIEVAVRPDRAERSHGRSPADRLECRDVIDGRDLGSARHRTAGEGRLEQFGQ